MARDQVDMTPIETRDELVAWFAEGVQAEVAVPHRHRAREIRLHGRRPPAGSLRGPAQHPRAARRHAAPARLGADHRGRQHHRPVRRHRRRRDLARAGRPVRTVRRAGRDRAPDLLGADGASRAGARGGAPARHRLPRARHDADLDARRHADDAEGPLPDHDRLHAEGRHARPRHDVPHLHGADQSRLLVRSRHGQEAARRRSRCSRSRPRCSPTRRSPKASRTAFCRSARRSGATPTTTAPACCRGRSSPAWASSAGSTTRSTCRCISSSAATTTSTSPANRSAI